MEFCCPSPENTAFVPNSLSLKHRKNLRFLMYGQVGVCFAKMVLYTPLSGFLQLITLWIAYMGWATMHFCQVMIFMICLGIDLLFILIDFQRMNLLLSGAPMMKMLFWMLIIYDVVGLFITYRAYSNFKENFYAGHPQGYSMFDAASNMGQYDNEGGRGRGQVGRVYNAPNNNAYQQEQQPARSTTQGAYTAFSGQGVRLGGATA